MLTKIPISYHNFSVHIPPALFFRLDQNKEKKIATNEKKKNIQKKKKNNHVSAFNLYCPADPRQNVAGWYNLKIAKTTPPKEFHLKNYFRNENKGEPPEH